MTYVFLSLASLSVFGIFLNSKMKNGHGMAYSAVIAAVWIGAALWWSGRIG